MRLNEILATTMLGATLLGSTSALAEQWRDGGEVYEKVCRHCHEMGIGPTIKGRQLPAQYIEWVVRHGNRAMPAFRISEIDTAVLGEVARMISDSSVVVSQQVR